jgi:hypothetical protein
MTIPELISQYAHLVQAGDHFVARCPFHEEKTPTDKTATFKLYLHQGEWRWFCYVCSEGGDVLAFIERLPAPTEPATETLEAQQAYERSRYAYVAGILRNRFAPVNWVRFNGIVKSWKTWYPQVRADDLRLIAIDAESWGDFATLSAIKTQELGATEDAQKEETTS